MGMLKDILLYESELSRKREVMYVINTINSTYNEWNKISRRKNAVSLVTTTANKLSTIDPKLLVMAHQLAKSRAAELISRCLDIPAGGSVISRKLIYKKLYPLFTALQNEKLKYPAGISLKSAVCNEISAGLALENGLKNTVLYEPRVPKTYVDFLLAGTKPGKVYFAEPLTPPEDFGEFVSFLRKNLEKVN